MSKRPGDPGYAAGWCIHYRGISDGKGGRITSCEKGVEYSTFEPRNRQPCFLTEDGKSKPDALTCEHLRRPTTEEINLHETWLETRLNKTVAVLVAIEPWRKKHKGRSFGEIIECPACKGRLQLSISACNGHVHGHCATEGCVSWME